ncbi:BTB and MATH domain-containing protein 36-like [Mya arenaria]|uniref:BTB and MATH domain-containing protein 36-like n=1 Tax=Mya arenaria TaxID=6604 RepID=UPI0022DFA05B|nr:BTB and MATH domain-containing protein 36-like [Mya arenaria]
MATLLKNFKQSLKVRQEPDIQHKSEDDDTSAPEDKNVPEMAHAQSLCELDHPFRHPNETSDLRLIVEGRPLYVSKVVLSLVSPVFKRLFLAGSVESMVELPLPDRKYADMVQFLCCVYPDILAPITEINIVIILDLAEEFQVHRLVEKCEEFLANDIAITPTSSPYPQKVVRYLYLSDKYGLEDLQKAAFETAARMQSDMLENVREFWQLPSVTTTSVFIRRLKLLEVSGRAVRTRIKEAQNHCTLYHKGERTGDNVCNKCFAGIGKFVISEMKYF